MAYFNKSSIEYLIIKNSTLPLSFLNRLLTSATKLRSLTLSRATIIEDRPVVTFSLPCLTLLNIYYSAIILELQHAIVNGAPNLVKVSDIPFTTLSDAFFGPDDYFDTNPRCGQVSDIPLYEHFARSDHCHFGRYSMQLTHQWRVLPSIYPTDELESYYISTGDEVEITFYPQDSAYYIRLVQKQTAEVIVEVFFKHSLIPSSNVDELPEDIRTLVEYCRDESRGACRHRCVAFAEYMQKHSLPYEWRIWTNDVHVFVYIKHEEKWTLCDLGGTVGIKLEINSTQLENAEKHYRQQQSQQVLPSSTTLSYDYLTQYSATSLLVTTEDAEALSWALQYSFQAKSLPFFYIDQPALLQCEKPFWDKTEGKMKKGPGGPLFDFLQANHAQAVIIINYELFDLKQRVHSRTLFSSSRSVENQSIPENYQVIGIINPQTMTPQQRVDFYSYFSSTYSVSDIPAVSNNSLVASATQTVEAHTIELCGGDHWENDLLGQPRIQQGKLSFKKGALSKALEQNHSAIALNNPPVDDPYFNQFLRQMALHRAIFYRGIKGTPLPPNLQLFFTHHLCFSDAQQWVSTAEEKALSSTCVILNPATVQSFLSQYLLDESDDTLTTGDGLIKQHHHATLTVYLTAALSETDWLRLFKALRKNQCQLQVIMTAPLALPAELATVLRPLSPASLPLPTAHTLWRRDVSEPAIATYPKDTVVIDVTDLTAADLLPSMTARLDTHSLVIKAKEKPCELARLLKAYPRVVLTGQWSQALAYALEPFIFERLWQAQATGQLILESNQPNVFSLLPQRDESPETASLTMA